MIVYGITCVNCNQVYLTSRELHKGFTEQRVTVRKRQPCHFLDHFNNVCSHTDYLKITQLEPVPLKTE